MGSLSHHIPCCVLSSSQGWGVLKWKFGFSGAVPTPSRRKGERRTAEDMKDGRRREELVAVLELFESSHSAVSLDGSYLDELSVAGECAAEYLALYQKLITSAHWKVYLAARGVLPYVGNLITKVSRP